MTIDKTLLLSGLLATAIVTGGVLLIASSTPKPVIPNPVPVAISRPAIMPPVLPPVKVTTKSVTPITEVAQRHAIRSIFDAD